jgi:bacteriocin-like protein
LTTTIREIQGTGEQLRELATDELSEKELDAVTGGLVVNAIIAILIGLLPASPKPATSTTGCGCQ